MLPVDLALLFLTGKTLAQQKRNLGAVQADTLSPLLQRAGHIGHQARIHIERQAVIVQGLTGQVTQGFQITRQGLILLQQFLITLPQFSGGVELNRTIIAIDNQLAVLQFSIGKVDGTHNRGHTHGPRHDCHMGVARALD